MSALRRARSRWGRYLYGIPDVAQTLLVLAASVWLVMALTAPFAVSHPRDERTFATLFVGLGLLVAAGFALRHPGLVGASVAGLSVVLLVALAYPDDDTRHLRQFLFAGAYVQHEPGREHYAFQPVGDWPWSTYFVAVAVGACVVAAVILLAEEVRRRRRPVARRDLLYP